MDITKKIKKTHLRKPAPPYKKVSPLVTLASYPFNIHVHGKNEDEIILLFIREHKVTLFFDILLYSIVLFVPYFIRISLELLNKYLLGNTISFGNFFQSTFWIAGNVLWLAYALRGYFNIFFRWFYNINILTNNRLMDVDFIGIFSVRIEETSITSIEDVKDHQKGIIQSVFNMGDIEIFTASGKTTFSLNNVPKAYKVRDFMMDVIVAERKKQNAS